MKLFTCFLLFTFMLFPQSNWFWQNPTPQGNDLNDVKLTTLLIGYAAGNFGTILKTTDAGITWNPQYLQDWTNAYTTEPYTVFHLYSIAFENTINGLAVGKCSLCGDEVIYKTTDGGSNWILQELGTAGGVGALYSVFYADASNVIAAGEQGKILKSTDGGDTWTSTTSGTIQTLYGLYFTSASNGIAVGASGAIITTADGGTNWTVQTSPTTNTLYSVDFANATTGIAVGEAGTVLKTNDGGITWTSISSGTTKDLKDIAFTDVNNASVVGADGTILSTTDGGASWVLNASGTTQKLNAVGFNGSFGLTVGTYGMTVKTINSGLTWFSLSKLSTTNNMNDVSFVNKKFGAAVGDNGTILTTSNGGDQWILQSSGTTIDLRGVSFATPNLGIAVGGKYYPDTAIVLRTVDGGVTWTQQELYLNLYLNDVQMVNNKIGYASGSVILKTTDSGITWKVVNTFEGGRISFSDINVGAVFGAKTTDGGNSWTEFELPLRPSYDIAVTDIDHMIVVGSMGQIATTTDGGLTWSRQVTESMQDLNGVSFIDNDNGIIVGAGFDPGELEEGIILRTKDGGVTWAQEYTYGVRLNKVQLINNNTASVVGNRGTILRMGKEKKVRKDAAELITPTEFQLYQNYPNPFNPNTRIRFSVAQQQLVQIKIYDVLGKELAVLVNDILPVGNHERTWNASAYASGIYYYRITAGSFTENRKMILLK